jgi:hypothetical protein
MEKGCVLAFLRARAPLQHLRIVRKERVMALPDLTAEDQQSPTLNFWHIKLGEIIRQLGADRLIHLVQMFLKVM